MEWIKILIAFAFVAGLSLLQNKINTKRHIRANQFLLPLFSVLYGIACIILCIVSIDNFKLPVEDDHFLWNSEILIFNLLVLLCFILLKCILCPLLSLLCKKKQILEKTVFTFYAYDEIYDKWFLLPHWEQFRKYLFAIECALTIGSSLFAGLTWVVDKQSAFRFPAIPVVALLITSELYAFLNGQTREEYKHTVSGDASESQKVSNFYKLRSVLEVMLPNALRTSQTGFEYFRTQSTTDYLHRLSKSEDENDRLVATFFNIGERSKQADADSVFATVQLMHRKSVVFFNPFYRDLEAYIVLPMMNALLQGKKCLVVAGRISNGAEIRTWLEEMISRYSHLHTLWQVDALTEKPTDCEIGVLCFPQLYDQKMLEVNRSFFSETDFVLLLEPSVMINTGQIALSILSDEINSADTPPVYCVCDRITDGLMDTLSHLLHTELTDIAAAPVPRCIYAGLGWDADSDFLRDQLFDKQTRYLGNGTELAAIAIKNQIPLVTWIGETKTPLRDLHWIVGQHYATICRYMNQPTQQKALYDKIKFVDHMWNCTKEKEQFIIAEDEFCNLFSALRAYLSRGISQSFVNILSENYLLRDYMCNNKQIFIANPNAIPSLTADYAKTERNTLIKLLLQMSFRPVTDEEILHEFRLVGLNAHDAFAVLSDTIKKYTFADNSVITTRTAILAEHPEQTGYTIAKDVFDTYFTDSLKTAYFVLEEEKTEQSYLDSKMFSHVTQVVLPGQGVVYEGKYYTVSHISPKNGVILRRASNLYDTRQYYRQIRTYHLSEDASPCILSQKEVKGTQFTFLQTDFYVQTDGYLVLRSNNDLRTAKLTDLRQDPSVNNYVRKYRNKTILRIQLSEATPNLCFTLCVLLSELFRSVFPDAWQYLAVCTQYETDSALQNLLYHLQGTLKEGCIYIIEDSQIDLGLTECVEKNWDLFMEILADYLDWHEECKMQQRVDETDTGDDSVTALVNRLIHGNASDDTTGNRSESTATSPTAGSDGKPLTQSAPCDDYLYFGFNQPDPALQTDILRTYLFNKGYADSILTCARKRNNDALKKLMITAVNYCDFCSQPLTGVSYEVLTDGRVRCNDCSASAVTGVEEFSTLFRQVLKMMEAFYNAKISVPVTVETADARELAAQAGSVFKPGKEPVGRVLGFAKRSFGKYKLLIENGSPRLATLVTMVHELTHIWQYINWNERTIRKAYNFGNRAKNEAARLIVYEGMAMWTSIQYLYLIGETYYATLQEAIATERKDVYGLGFLMFRERYPLAKDGEMLTKSPFDSDIPLDPNEVQAVIDAIMTARSQQQESNDQNGDNT